MSFSYYYDLLYGKKTCICIFNFRKHLKCFSIIENGWMRSILCVFFSLPFYFSYFFWFTRNLFKFMHNFSFFSFGSLYMFDPCLWVFKWCACHIIYNEAGFVVPIKSIVFYISMDFVRSYEPLRHNMRMNFVFFHFFFWVFKSIVLRSKQKFAIWIHSMCVCLTQMEFD